MDRVRNEEVHRRAGIEWELVSRSDQRVLSWFGHVERMDEYCMARSGLMAEVSGGWVQGKPRLGPRWKINSFLSEISVCWSCTEKITLKIERAFSVILRPRQQSTAAFVICMLICHLHVDINVY